LIPTTPGFGEARWITSEDVNVEHLLDVFTSADANSENVWDACGNFMHHLYWHKPRLIVLGPKIEGLPDDHPSKALCLHRLSQLFNGVGNLVEQKRLLTHTLKLWRERGDDNWVAETLRSLSDANRQMGLYEEGIQQAKEASEAFRTARQYSGQARSLIDLAWLLRDDKQLDAAEEAASHAIDLLESEKGEQFKVCFCHRTLGDYISFQGRGEKAGNHFEIALGIASSFNWHDELFWIHYDPGIFVFDQGRFDDAHAHIERAKSHAVNAYYLGRAMKLQADLWYNQHRLEEAKSEALRAVEVFEKLGAAKDVDDCREILRVGGVSIIDRVGETNSAYIQNQLTPSMVHELNHGSRSIPTLLRSCCGRKLPSSRARTRRLKGSTRCPPIAFPFLSLNNFDCETAPVTRFLPKIISYHGFWDDFWPVKNYRDTK
jgi:tetratricopeptide (TPR) repeat protein